VPIIEEAQRHPAALRKTVYTRNEVPLNEPLDQQKNFKAFSERGCY
jgi:hypothetical protein